ncbi:YdcF family protein [Craterilacuibacter sp. RT1T]|uniref:YdcF family protein n=1 Tax=Craterilacuibacter sp. RT1T TaxID=2942211 RepID=UPI0020BF97E8|nr:YdcF family protein [Craterilacuibacter sp. RT1T]MCL6263099.1 YdcF family protein [Craterilacuibacter sp. RT1T]
MCVTTAPGVLFNQVFGALLLPPVNCLLLAGFGFWLFRRKKRGGLALLVLSMLLLYAFSTPRMAIALNAALENQTVARLADVRQSGAIVVLGGGKKPAPEYGENVPSGDTAARLRYAVHLHKASTVPLLLTGGAPLGGEPEAWVMQRMLWRDYGVKPYWVESESLNTEANARLSAAMLKNAGVKRITLVTQAWHLRRAVPLFEAQGLEVVPAPTGFTRYDGEGIIWYLPSGRAMQETHQALREWVGMFYHGIRNSFS